MAASNDDILKGINSTNNLLQDFLDKFTNNGSSAFSRGGYDSFFSKSVGGEKFTKDDFDRRIEKYKKAINGEEEKTREEIKEEIIKSDKKILELEDEINKILAQRNELIEKQEKNPNGFSEEDAKQLAEYNEKLDKHNDALKKNISLRKELDSTPTGFEKVMGVVGKVTNGIKAIYNEANKLAEPWNRLDSAASKYARSVGMAGDAYKKFRDTSLQNIDKNKLSASSGLKPEEIINAQLNFVKATGRNIGIDNKTQSDIAHMSKLLGDGGLNLAASLDKFGLGMSDVAELTTEMFNEAAKSGISFEEYTNNVSKNLNIAQNYTFKNGIKGLESMAKKSTAIKLDMQQIASFAEKVSSVEGAVQTSAKLQVLGGPFAQLADPMGMLNEGLNDMEGLFDRVSKMVGGLGSFNKESGEVEVSSYNKRRIRAAAEAMGMDYGQLMESVNTQARRNEIGRQISSSASLSGLDNELKELIKNTATFKDGKAGITTAKGEFKALEGLSGKEAEDLKEELKLQNQTKEQDIKSIVQSTKGAQEALEGMKGQIDARQGSMLGWLGKLLKGLHTLAGTASFILTAVVALKAMNSIGNIADGFTGGKGKGKAKRRVGNILEGIKGNKAKGAANKIKTPKGAVNKTKTPKGAANKIDDAIFDSKTGRWRNSKGQFIKAPKGSANTISKSGNFLTKGFNSVKNFGSKTLGSLKGLGGKTVGKIATKLGPKALGIAGRLSKAAAAGGGLASVATVTGEIGNIATDMLVENGKIKKGGGAHHAMSAGSNALAGAGMGAMVGSIIPGIGTAIGAGIGGIIGAVSGLAKSGAFKQAVGKTAKSSKKSLGIDKTKSITPRVKSSDVLDQYTSRIKPVVETGVTKASNGVVKPNKEIRIKTDPHDIKLNGTLNIKGENGQTVDLMKELNNNPRMKRQLAEMLENEMGVLSKGGVISQGL